MPGSNSPQPAQTAATARVIRFLKHLPRRLRTPDTVVSASAGNTLSLSVTYPGARMLVADFGPTGPILYAWDDGEARAAAWGRTDDVVAVLEMLQAGW